LDEYGKAAKQSSSDNLVAWNILWNNSFNNSKRFLEAAFSEQSKKTWFSVPHKKEVAKIIADEEIADKLSSVVQALARINTNPTSVLAKVRGYMLHRLFTAEEREVTFSAKQAKLGQIGQP
jgi:hypothetical protein